MKQRQHDQKSIEDKLRQLPEVRDSRSRQEIYYNVMAKTKAKSPRNNRRKWLVPGITTVFAIMLLALIIPNMIPQSQQMSSDTEQSEERTASETEEAQEEAPAENGEGESSSPDEEAASDSAVNEESGQDAADEAAEEEAPQEEMTEEETLEALESPEADEPARLETSEAAESRDETPAVEEEWIANDYLRALSSSEIEEGNVPVTIPLQDAEYGITVPITFLIEGSFESAPAFFEALNRNYAGEEIGLSGSVVQNIRWSNTDDASNAWQADFEESQQSLSSAQGESFLNSLEESLRYTDVSEILFSENGEPGVEFGNYGLLDSYLVQEENRGYFAYSSNQDVTLLVSGAGAGQPTANEQGELFSFEETLQQMETDPESEALQSPMPEGLDVAGVEGEGTNATVTFTESSELPESWNSNIFTDAVLFAASDFGYETVAFEKENSESSADWLPEESLEVPEAPNLVTFE